MIKGVSRQVIVVHSPDKKLFEQAIFILNDDALGQGVTDEMLLKEARQVVQGSHAGPKRRLFLYGAFWSVLGAAATGLIWLLTMLL